MNLETKTCQNCKKDFTIEPDDFSFYEKMKVPAPTWCPDCRYQRRLINRNEWNFYRRDCSLCGKNIVSIHGEHYRGPVYCRGCWWGDGWDPFVYGKEYDFNKTFFEQYALLQSDVPRLALVSENSVNSEYTNQSQNNKNCYFIIASDLAEDCMYGNWNNQSKECIDCYMVEKCELLYESINCRQCYKGAYLANCYDCTNCFFSQDCVGCLDCFGCFGLRKQQCCFFNEQLTKEEYKNKIEQFSWDQTSIREMNQATKEFFLQFPHKYFHGTNNIESTGDYIERCGLSRLIFNCRHNKETHYSQDAWHCEDCLDTTEALVDTCYEIQGCATSSRSIVLRSCWDDTDCFYCDLSFASNDLFGCVGIRSKKYCILNKQYSKEEYIELKAKIIDQMRKNKEWGEYTPASISLFAYNESVAQEYFPLSRDEALAKGYRWYDRPQRDYAVTKTVEELPRTIEQTPHSFISEIIECASTRTEEDRKKYRDCTTAFRVTPEELILYKKIGVPIPCKCSPCRRQDRFELRNPRKLWTRSCMCTKGNHDHEGKCTNKFETSYSSDRPEIVYCESCYQKEVL